MLLYFSARAAIVFVLFIGRVRCLSLGFFLAYCSFGRRDSDRGIRFVSQTIMRRSCLDEVCRFFFLFKFFVITRI